MAEKVLAELEGDPQVGGGSEVTPEEQQRICEAISDELSFSQYDESARSWWHSKSSDQVASALDFFNNEADSARLLEAMRAPLLVLETLPASQWACWPCGGDLDMVGTHPDRKTAIVLAACAWLGIEVKEQ